MNKKIKCLEALVKTGSSEKQRRALMGKALKIRKNILQNKGIGSEGDEFAEIESKKKRKEPKWFVCTESVCAEYHFEGLYATIALSYCPTNEQGHAELSARIIGHEPAIYDACERADLDDPFL